MAQETIAVTHVMVDIETLGTKPGSAIASIGAVVFDPFSEEITRPFSLCINPATCDQAGLKIDPRTVLWWFKQSEEARDETFFSPNVVSLEVALSALVDYLSIDENVRIWSHGAPFDPVLLEAAFNAVGRKAPWKFWNIRDTRTIFELAGIKSLHEYRSALDTTHSALADATVQARAVCDAYRRLELKVAA